MEVKDNRGNTALLRACQHGNTGVAAALLSARADPTVRNDDGQDTLVRATEGGHDGVVALLRMFAH